MAEAIQTDGEVARLRRAVEELSILNDLSRSIGASVNSEEIMHTIVRRSVKAVLAEQGVITLVETAATDAMRTLVRTQVSTIDNLKFHLNQALIGWMHLNKRPLSVEKPQDDERFRGVQWETNIRSLLCVPLLVKADLRGVLTVFNKQGSPSFTLDDQRLLAIIAGQSAQVIENARLAEEEKQLLRMQQEVQMAARIQFDLLPKEGPNLPGYEIFGTSIPARTVGGDYYDFIPVDGKRWAVCVGDVSGKGLPASLLMANLQATLRSQTASNATLKECMERSNNHLFHSSAPDKFATVFHGIIDPALHRFTYCNAGHEPPLLYTDSGEIRALNIGGVPIGLFEGFVYEEQEVQLNPGETILIVTDGITEAMNNAEDQYGSARLEKIFSSLHDRPLKEAFEAIVNDVKKHTGTRPQHDDITLVGVRRLR